MSNGSIADGKKKIAAKVWLMPETEGEMYTRLQYKRKDRQSIAAG